MYCVNCGKEIDDKAVICVHCGVMITKKANVSQTNSEDRASCGMSLLSFFIPIVGFIMGCIYLSQGKKKAGENCIAYAIIGMIIAFGLISSASH